MYIYPTWLVDQWGWDFLCIYEKYGTIAWSVIAVFIHSLTYTGLYISIKYGKLQFVICQGSLYIYLEEFRRLGPVSRKPR